MAQETQVDKSIVRYLDLLMILSQNLSHDKDGACTRHRPSCRGVARITNISMQAKPAELFVTNLFEVSGLLISVG
jgi:hypothetical protein